ncbi:MAG: lactate utilization protein [Sphaerochaetaceae bacterium]|jgi:hypothetical protein|nr:lactate utilization protein [Sphaerochaetaceae bacterium]
MDANLYKQRSIKAAHAIEALKKNGFEAALVPSIESLPKLVTSLIPDGSSIGLGGSVSLVESGVLEAVRKGPYKLIDRYEKGLSKEQLHQRLREGLLSDVFLTSTNAITLNGELYNVDGTSNRTAAMLFGPEKVIVVASASKIVSNLAEAIVRVKTICAPANAIRLDCPTFCASSGSCIKRSFSPENLMCLPAGACESTICSNAVIMGHQKAAGRITVLICLEDLGY